MMPTLSDIRQQYPDYADMSDGDLASALHQKFYADMPRAQFDAAIGGFGSYVLQALADHGALDSGIKLRTMVLPDVFLDQDSPAAMYAKAGLDARGIVAKVFEALGKDVKAETVKLA